MPSKLSLFLLTVAGGQPQATMPHLLLASVAAIWMLGMLLAEVSRAR
jgi:hypothetical protein